MNAVVAWRNINICWCNSKFFLFVIIYYILVLKQVKSAVKLLYWQKDMDVKYRIRMPELSPKYGKKPQELKERGK